MVNDEAVVSEDIQDDEMIESNVDENISDVSEEDSKESAENADKAQSVNNFSKKAQEALIALQQDIQTDKGVFEK